MPKNQHITGSPAEIQNLADSIREANDAQAASQQANKWARRVFIQFCEGRGISGATFVAIEDGVVVVTLPEPAVKPEPAP